MKNFFKSIGRGIIYFFTPFAWVIGIAIGGVIGIFVIVIFLILSLFAFFIGKNLIGDLPEDKRAKELKEGKPAVNQGQFQNNIPRPNNIQNQPIQQNQNNNFQQFPEQNPAKNDSFLENERIYNRMMQDSPEEEFLQESIENDSFERRENSDEIDRNEGFDHD